MSEWISVKERLPESQFGEEPMFIDVLCYGMYKETKERVVIGSIYLEDGKIVSDYPTFRPTHWMELPAPPDLSTESEKPESIDTSEEHGDEVKV